jgi:hypothetical protein
VNTQRTLADTLSDFDWTKVERLDENDPHYAGMVMAMVDKHIDRKLNVQRQPVTDDDLRAWFGDEWFETEVQAHRA